MCGIVVWSRQERLPLPRQVLARSLNGKELHHVSWRWDRLPLLSIRRTILCTWVDGECTSLTGKRIARFDWDHDLQNPMLN